MTAFSVYDEDGKISGSHKVYEPEGYGKVLADFGMTFISHDTAGHADLDRHFVWNGNLSDRPSMPIAVPRKVIRAGEIDFAIFRNIPQQAMISVYCAGACIQTMKFEGKSPFEFGASVPGFYRVAVTLWPFRDWSTDIEVVQ